MASTGFNFKALIAGKMEAIKAVVITITAIMR